MLRQKLVIRRERVIFQHWNISYLPSRLTSQRHFKEEITINQRQTDDLADETIMLLNSNLFVRSCANHVHEIHTYIRICIRASYMIVERNPKLPCVPIRYHSLIILRNSACKSITSDGTATTEERKRE